ncbi:FadR/GntR family transcriptional regulator [Pedococcus sp. 5OH_020]|uniref:FadR/GntR family transcriptional regulator n=1 Tax=Pedococcus sp. 5OH_020 TaxID=2989814 RepID=UPI0022E9DDC3|nr:FCD domain-containing protein [Pedococcus sp. 5OH_020]
MTTHEEEPAAGGQRRYLAVAQTLLSAISGGEYPPGSRLPAHSEVAAQAGVSRATAREAFLALEVIGAIEVRHGDGTFVRGPAVRVGGVTGAALDALPHELVETRLRIEPVVTALAAQRLDRERLDGVARLLEEQQALVHEAKDVARFVALGLEFHAELAPACGNPLLADIVSQLVNVGRHPLWALVNQHALPDEASRQRQVDEHKSILRAIGRGEAELAKRLMEEHLGSLQARIFQGATPHAPAQ